MLTSVQQSKITDIQALATRLGQALDQVDGEMFEDAANTIAGLIQELGMDLQEAMERVPVGAVVGPKVSPKYTLYGSEYDPT